MVEVRHAFLFSLSQAVQKKINFDRKKVETLCKGKFFYVQSFELYGGEAGLYDFGPLGATLKSNVENLWK